MSRSAPRSGRRRPSPAWRVAAAMAWCIGALGGMAPTALLGDPPAGPLAGPLLGAVALGIAAPFVLLPLVAAHVAAADDWGTAAAWHAAGRPVRRRLGHDALVAGGAQVRLLAIAAAAAGLAAIGGRLGSGELLAQPLASRPGLPALALAVAGIAVATVVGALVAAAVPGRVPAVMTIVCAFLATGAVASLVVYVPGLQRLFWAMPAAALWPFTADTVDTPMFARAVPASVRATSGAAWLVVLLLLGHRRLRRRPYPTTTEPANRRRRRLEMR